MCPLVLQDLLWVCCQVQSQKSHKLHTWAQVNCSWHTSFSEIQCWGKTFQVKPIKVHFITFLLLGGVWAFTIKATSTLAGASTSRGPCQPFEEESAAAWVILGHHTVPVVLESAHLRNNPQQGSNGTANITWAGSGTGFLQAPRTLQPPIPRWAQASPRSLCWHWPSDLGHRGAEAAELCDTSARSWHSLVFILKAAESKRQQPSNNDSEVICSNTCTRAITTVTGYLNW